MTLKEEILEKTEINEVQARSIDSLLAKVIKTEGTKDGLEVTVEIKFKSGIPAAKIKKIISSQTFTNKVMDIISNYAYDYGL